MSVSPAQPSRPSLWFRLPWLPAVFLWAAAVALVFLGVWRAARRELLTALAHETTLIAHSAARLPTPSPSNLNDLLQHWPDAPFARAVYALGTAERIVAATPGDAPVFFSPDGLLVHRQTLPNSPLTLTAAVARGTVWAHARREAQLPLLLVSAFCAALGGGLTWQARQRRQRLERLASAARAAAAGRFADAPVGEQQDAGPEAAIVAGLHDALRLCHADAELLRAVGRELAAAPYPDQGIPIVLDAMQRAADAAGARAVIVNPDGGRPLRYGVGPAADQLAQLDRRLLLHMRNHAAELTAADAAAVRAGLEWPEERPLPVQGLAAFPLVAHNQLRGVIWVGYAQPVAASEWPRLNVLRSLAEQSEAHLASALLFYTAESGRRRLAAVLACTGEAIVVTDPTDRILLVNTALEQAFKLDGRTLANRLVRDVIPHPELQRLLTGHPGETDGRELAGENGQRYHASVAQVRGQAGQILGRVAVLHNISRFKELDELKSEFIAMLSHDLRNPLAFMHTYASLLPELGPLNDRQQESVDQILHGIERMHRTIGDLLDLNRIESADDTLNFAPIDAQEFLEAAAEEHAAYAQAVGNQFVVQAPPAPITLIADRWSLHWALNNLIANALKYAPGSGAITLSAQETAEDVVLTVRDQGPGIGKADQMRIFEKFYRASRPAALSVEGSGLGLAVVKSVAERHGGRAWVESEPGQGSAFHIAVPRTPVRR